MSKEESNVARLSPGLEQPLSQEEMNRQMFDRMTRYEVICRSQAEKIREAQNKLDKAVETMGVLAQEIDELEAEMRCETEKSIRNDQDLETAIKAHEISIRVLQKFAQEIRTGKPHNTNFPPLVPILSRN